MEFLRAFLRLYLGGNQWWLVVSQNIICFFTLGQIQQIFSLKAQQQQRIPETPARKMESLYDLQCKINACFSTDLDAEIDRPSQELSTMTIWQILIFPTPTQSMAFIRLRLILQRQTSGRSRLCLLPFWRTVVVTYSLLLVRLAAKGSPRLSHWYDIVTSRPETVGSRSQNRGRRP